MSVKYNVARKHLGSSAKLCYLLLSSTISTHLVYLNVVPYFVSSHTQPATHPPTSTNKLPPHHTPRHLEPTRSKPRHSSRCSRLRRLFHSPIHPKSVYYPTPRTHQTSDLHIQLAKAQSSKAAKTKPDHWSDLHERDAR
jgi:hypothetical protein